MSLKRILILITCILIPIYSAVADCTFSLNGRTTTMLPKTVWYNRTLADCKKLNVPVSGVCVTNCDLVCSANSKLSCQKHVKSLDEPSCKLKIAEHTEEGLSVGRTRRVKKSICKNSGADMTNCKSDECDATCLPIGGIQCTEPKNKYVHSGVPTYDGKKKITVVDACDIDGAYSTTKPHELPDGKKVACIPNFRLLYVSTPIAMAMVVMSSNSGKYGKPIHSFGKIVPENCTVDQTVRASKTNKDMFIRCITDKNIYVEFMFGDMNRWSSVLDLEGISEYLCHNASNISVERKTDWVSGYGERTDYSYGAVMGLFCHFDNNEVCSEINKLLKDVPGFHATSDGDSCHIHGNIKDTDGVFVDTTFKDVTIKPSQVMGKFIRNYFKTNDIKFGQPMYYTLTTKSSNIDVNLTVYGWPVKVKGKPRILVFRGLEPEDESVALSGLDEAVCIEHNGLFDGQNCWLISYEECISGIGVELKRITGKETVNPVTAHTSWYGKYDTCQLGYSTSLKRKEKWKKGAIIAGNILLTGAAIAVGGPAVTIAMLGQTANALATASALANAAKEIPQVVITKETLRFLRDASNCHKSSGCVSKCRNGNTSVGSSECLMCSDKCSTTPANCAEKLFENNFEYMINLTDDLTEDQVKAVDASMERLLEFLPCDPEYIKQFTLKLANKAKNPVHRTKEVLNNINDALGIIAAFSSLGSGGPARIAKSRFFTIVNKTITTSATAYGWYGAAGSAVNINTEIQQ